MTPAASRDWLPYCGAAPVPDDWLGHWTLDPVLLMVMAGAAALLWRAADSASKKRLSGAALAIGLLLFVSPFCALTSALFSARVVHHVLLTAVVASLVAFSLPRDRLPPIGPLSVWTAVQALIFWSWHAPPLYGAALSSHLIYWAMQLSLLGSALGFWIALRRAAPTSAVGALLFTMVQMGLLGALITFAVQPLYAPHFATTVPWDFSPLEDQQLAGLIMWAPSAGIYLAVALVLTNRWLGRETSAAAS